MGLPADFQGVFTTDVSGQNAAAVAKPAERLRKPAQRRLRGGAKKSFSHLVDNPMTVAILRPLVEPDRFTVPRREIAEQTKVDGIKLVAILPPPS